MEVEFYFDVACPQAYLAYTQIERLEARHGAHVVMRPVSLAGLHRIWTQGEDGLQARLSPARRRMGHRDLMRQAEILQVFINESVTLDPPSSTDAMGLIVGAPAALRPTLIRNLFQVLWVDGEDIGNRGVLEWVAEISGVDPELMDRSEVRRQLEAATEAAANLGVFGVPSFRLDGRMWWGMDRMPFVEQALSGAAEAPSMEPRMGGQIEFFHDFASPFSYLGATQVEAFAAHHGAELIWRPILLGGLFKRIHTPIVPLSIMSRPRREYMARDLMEWAEHWRVPFQFNSHFPLNTLLALRVALAVPDLTLPLYRAAWADNRDIGQPEVIAQVIEAAGMAAEQVLRLAGEEEIKDRLRANTEAAEAMGACGVPTFRINDRLVIWGQDRFDMVSRVLGGWVPAVDVQGRI